MEPFSIKENLLSTWKGDEKLVTVFWLYFVAGHLGVACILGITVGIDILLLKSTDFPVITLIALLIIVVPYLIWIFGALWNSAFNAENRIWGYLARFLVIVMISDWIYGILSGS